ncbi:MAG: DUF2304 domain-containing protein [Thermodesulfobacteriota bacterium]
MTFRQKIFALVAGLALFFFIIAMVRKKKLKEEYSLLWIATGFAILAMVFWYDLLLFLTRLIGAVLPTTTLFLFSLIFLMLITLHFSSKISILEDRVEKLSRASAILSAENEELRSLLGAAEKEAGAETRAEESFTD